jgi:hypothetical protein
VKAEDIVSGTVDRVGFVGFVGDVTYMTLLLKGNNQVFTVFFDGNNPASNAASLTQSGDEVEFQISEYARVKCKNFSNKTVASRMQEAVADAVARASNPPGSLDA